MKSNNLLLIGGGTVYFLIIAVDTENTVVLGQDEFSLKKRKSGEMYIPKTHRKFFQNRRLNVKYVHRRSYSVDIKRITLVKFSLHLY